MVSKKVTVKNPTGLHLRPAGILCNEAMKYQSLLSFSSLETQNIASLLARAVGIRRMHHLLYDYILFFLK